MAGNKTGNKSGGRSSGPTAKDRPKERPSGSMAKTASGAKTYTDTRTGVSSPAPKYGGASIKGLTSKDPGNVARNRAGAAKYGTMSERIAASGRDGNADKAATQAAYRAASARTTAPSTASLFAAKQAAAAAAPAAPTTMATKPPAGYRPGIDPEFNYGTGAAATTPRPAMAPRPAMTAMAAPRVRVNPTITLAKGGKAPRKKK